MRPNTPQKNRVLANHSRKSGESVMNWFSGTLIIKYDTGVEELYDNLSYREAVEYVKEQAKQHVIERASYIPASTNISV